MTVPTSIPAMVLDTADRFGDADAVIEAGRRRSFTEVGAAMLEVARALAASGIEPGDRVALWAPNSSAWMDAALGILAAGAWLVPLNTRFRGEEAAYILDKVDAKAVLTCSTLLGADYLGMLHETAPGLPALHRAVLLDADLDPEPGSSGRPGGRPGSSAPAGDRHGATGWADFCSRAADVPESDILGRIDRIGPDSISDVIFTSGTTGTPKGVMLRHGASLAAYAAYNLGYGIDEGDRALIALPFSHTFGYKAGWMLDLMYGAATVPMPVFDPLLVLQTIATERITYMPGSPTMFFAVLDHPDRPSYDLSSLRGIVVAASTVPVELIYRLMDELSLDTCLAGYGLTETHGLVSTTLPGDRAELVATTVGTPIPGVEIRVVDEAGADVAPGAPGELLVRGYNVMTGYYGEPEATGTVVVDGWLRTGDIVVLDEGYIRITDRKKDLFIVGGFNVAPAEVEKCLSGLDEIAQVAVIGVPDDYFGEVGMAFVIPRAGAGLTEDEVVAYARRHLANYKVPRKVCFVSTFPLNATGKVLKNDLRQQAATAEEPRAAPAHAHAPGGVGTPS